MTRVFLPGFSGLTMLMIGVGIGNFVLAIVGIVVTFVAVFLYGDDPA